jgi:hypothetical protein
MSDHSETFGTQDSMREIWAQELSVVAAQFVEAACTARDGDPEATRAHVAHALALLKGLPNLGPGRGTHRVVDPDPHQAAGATRWSQRQPLLSCVQKFVWHIASRLCVTSAHCGGPGIDADDAGPPLRDCDQLWHVRSTTLHSILRPNRR